jgi:hypothetical protein
MDNDTFQAQLSAELRRVGLSADAAGAAFTAACTAVVPADWLLPADLPLRALRAVPDGAGPAAFAAALDRELAPLRAHFARQERSPGRGAP